METLRFLKKIERDPINFIKYVAGGALGFLIGGLLLYPNFVMPLVDDNILETSFNFILQIFSYLFWGGAIAGAIFGIMPKKPKEIQLRDVVQSVKLFIAGVISTFLGLLVIQYVFMFTLLQFFPSGTPLEAGDIAAGPVAFAFIGAFIGIFYGVALWDFGKALILGISGWIGFFIGTVVGLLLVNTGVLAFFSTILIGGAFLGAGMYFVKKNEA